MADERYAVVKAAIRCRYMIKLALVLSVLVLGGCSLMSSTTMDLASERAKVKKLEVEP